MVFFPLLYSLYAVYYIKLFLNVEPLAVSWDKSYFVKFLIHWLILFTNIFFRRLAPVSLWVSQAPWFSFLSTLLAWFWCKGYTSLMQVIQGMVPLLFSERLLCTGGIISSSDVWSDSAVKPQGPRQRAVQVLFLSKWVWVVDIFPRMFPFHLNFQIFSFIICRICNDKTSFMPAN